mmetsp:Transcript_85732/g.227818  ORF Transcript_85732/g.227818 Transcript_85732/m.227818 type:complete len:436 (-) Transcript_85732:127-1434(-)|eukprot:CAMPEP_0171174506 /NCGR_PEP_ID=MMETSP0790-20130122/10762_1 /TAXON_ID=2925 /ORGANISM="Alexandrium catenella, Strain OF101" /LENGTH=435 /DNA_ID=CAMNT_0011639381 /DNA_START=36 /DNA_END=1343 /DNA_ORIENTATION=-
MSPILHDVPIVGIFTSAVADSFTGLLWSPPSEDELKEVFDKQDTGRTGKLDRSGVADALRELDKSERQVQKIVDVMSEEEVDMEGFKELVVPSALPWSWHLGGVFPLPNHEKIFDTPVIGPILNATNDTLAQPVDNSLRAWRRGTYPASDHRMQMMFLEADADNSGRLDKQEIPQAMRRFFKTEYEIKCARDALEADVNLYEFKKMIRGAKYTPSVVNYVPMVGPALATNLLAAFDDDVPEDDQREAFEYIDKSKNGKLDKTDIAELLRELGKSELQIEKMVALLDEEELDFEGFKDFLQNGRSRRYIKTVSGYSVPNPAKVHDLPLVGTFTSLAQDTLVDAYSWTAGAGWKFLNKMEEEELKEKFEELDCDKDGSLTKKEVAKGLRELGMNEYDIKCCRDALTKEFVTFPEFCRVVWTGEADPPPANDNARTPS